MINNLKKYVKYLFCLIKIYSISEIGILLGNFMGLFKSRNIFRISPTDVQDNYLVNKVVGGENVEISVENSAYGHQLVVNANKTQNRKVRKLSESGVVNSDEYLVIVNASNNHVVVTLPPAKDFLGQLHIVCEDATHGIDIVPNASTSNELFDFSNVSFNAKGDSITLVSDRGASFPQADPNDPTDEQLAALNLNSDCYPGTWYVVGRYAALWYA